MATDQGHAVDRLGDILRAGDPAGEEQPLEPREVDQIRRRIVLAATERGARAGGWRLLPAVGALVGAGILLALAVPLLHVPDSPDALTSSRGTENPAAAGFEAAAARQPALTPAPPGPSVLRPAARQTEPGQRQAQSKAAPWATRAKQGAAQTAGRRARPRTVETAVVQPGPGAGSTGSIGNDKASPSEALPAGGSGERPRQLQFVTAGGTRIVWLLTQ